MIWIAIWRYRLEKTWKERRILFGEVGSSMSQQDIYEILYNSLDFHSGTVQSKNSEITDKSSLLFQVLWKGNIAFAVEGWNHFGWFFVKKNGQQVSALFHYNKINDITISMMKNLINEIEYGKYDNRKTQSDKIQDIIQQKQFTSYMNKTKWQEIIGEIKQIDSLLIMYKTIFDTSDPEFYWTIAGDEHFDFMNKALIEWFKISGNIKECEYLGRLLEPRVVQYDISNKIVDILQKYSIYYDYDEVSNAYVIYGYR